VNHIVSCSNCGWSEAANEGDLVISERDGTGSCIDHRIEHL
jgi:hypothetical protein